MRFQSRWRGRGFSLIELMIVVVILGVLAAIAIPVFSRYIRRGKASEAVTMLQNVRLKQEIYYQQFGRYVGIAAWFPTQDPSQDKHEWTGNANVKKDWDILGVRPGGGGGGSQLAYTYYQFRIGAGGIPGVADIDPDAVSGKADIDTDLPWWWAQARGDLDGDGTYSLFELTNQRETVYEHNPIE
jgi:prepilin-type N-terminal cleavage/methylation domain-containing protein